MPPRYATPDVFVREVPTGVRTIEGAATSVAAFVDSFARGPLHRPLRVSTFTDFERKFGGLHPTSEASYGVRQFFDNGGSSAWIVRVKGDPPGAADLIGVRAPAGNSGAGSGLYALDAVDRFNILCIPRAAELYDIDPQHMAAVVSAAEAYCLERRAFLIVDLPPSIRQLQQATDWLGEISSLRHPNAAAYFPRPRIPDPLDGFELRSAGASGTVAGIYARTDASRGVWKAPAGLEATLRGVSDLDPELDDAQNDVINPLGLNALRTFGAAGNVVWGARTLEGADELASEWKYIPVRRTALFLEESIHSSIDWAVFEPNDEPLWAELRLSLGTFMQSLFRRGAFQGSSPHEAYFVKVDAETTTQADIDRGVVNILVGFAPLKPAEFVVVKIQQRAGQVGA